MDYIAPLWMHPFEWVADPVQNYGGMSIGPFDNRTEPNRPDPVRTGITNNPRDNLVTLIAVTTGEEVFKDDNGNGHFDPGTESFIDSTEPFVDSNDNGTWDTGELFIDTNGNGVWDGKNNQFDASTLIWAKERIIWTGVPLFPEDLALPNPVVVENVPANVNVPHCGEVGPWAVIWSDPWYNAMTQDGNGDACSLGLSSMSSSGGTFKALVIGDPSSFGTGIGIDNYSYPPAARVVFNVADNHDCSQCMACQPCPGTGGTISTVDCPFEPAPGQPFSLAVVCNQTSSPISGDVLTMYLPGAVGFVQ